MQVPKKEEKKKKKKGGGGKRKRKTHLFLEKLHFFKKNSKMVVLADPQPSTC